VDAYAAELQTTIYKMAPDMPESEIITSFLNGLRPDLRNGVYFRLADTHGELGLDSLSIDKVVNTARLYESLQPATGSNKKVHEVAASDTATPVPSLTESLEAAVNQLTKQVEQLSWHRGRGRGQYHGRGSYRGRGKYNNEPNQERRRIQCYLCKGFGHKRAECPQNGQGSQALNSSTPPQQQPQGYPATRGTVRLR
jgi:hypothetical protein